MTPRPNQTSPLRKQTLIGMAAPVVAPKSEPPAQPALPPEADARQPIVSIAPAEAQIASNVRKNELRSSTLIGMAPVREPSEPPPSINAGPPSFASARDVALAISETKTDVASEPPPPSISAHPPSLASVRDVVSAVENEQARSDAPPANSTSPVGPTSRQTPAAAFARQAAPTASDAPPKKPAAERVSVAPAEPAPRRSGVSIALLAAAGLAIGILGYRALHHEGPPPDLAAMPTASTLPAPAAASPSAQNAEPTSTVHEPAPSATAADFHAAPPAPLDSPTDAKPVASAEPAAAASAAPAGVTRVTITSSPPKAKFFHYGKEVGTAPFVVDLQPGEKHAYEVWLPGHVTRKVFVDGSKTELNIGLREEK